MVCWPKAFGGKYYPCHREGNINRPYLQGVKFYSLCWERTTTNIHGLSGGLETWLLQKEAQTPLLANEFYAHC